MKKLITILSIVFAVGISAQTIQPTIGITYSGGLDYAMENEPMGLKVGLLFTPKKNKAITNIELSVNYLYAFTPENPNMPDRSFYNLKLQFSKEVVEYWNITAYGGYYNAFSGDVMRSFLGEYRTNLSYGLGLQVIDDYLTAEALYERICNFPFFTVGVTYKFKKIKL